MNPAPQKKGPEFRERAGNGKARVWTWSENPKITIRERVNDSGGIGYRVTFPKGVTGTRTLFKQSSDLQAAQEIARTKGRELQHSRATAFALTETEKMQAAQALRALRKADVNLPLDAVTREYLEARGTLAAGDTLTEATKALRELRAKAAGLSLDALVAYAVKRLNPEGGIKTLAEVIAEMISVKEGWHARGQLKDASIRDFKNRAQRIASEIGSVSLPQLDKSILLAWLAGLELSARSKKNYRMVLGEVLQFARQKRYIVESPLDEFTRGDIKDLEGGAEETQPKVLTVEEGERLLAAAFERADLDLGGAVVLGLFCGIRTEELKRLHWDAVRLHESEPYVSIGAEIAKKRRIRNVTIPSCAVNWLQRWNRTHEKVTRSTHANDFQKRFKRLCKEAKITWPANAMRHSFGTYHFAAYGNAMETSRLLGHKNDDAVLFAHYRALATKAQGEAWFQMNPPVTLGKLVKFRAPA